MKKGIYSVAIAAAMMLTAGSANAQVKISGKFDSYKGNKIVVASRTANGMKQDTIAVNNGAFEYTDANKKEMANYYLINPGERGAYMQVFAMPNQPLKLTGNMENYHIGGSPLYDKVNAICDQLDPIEVKRNAVMEEYRSQIEKMKTDAQKDSLVKVCQGKLDVANKELKDFVLSYIKAHGNEEATCYLIPMCEDVNAAINMLTPEVQKSAFAAYYKPAKMQADMQAKQREMEKKTAVGTMAPDFTLKDLNGKDFKLSSLRGKYVLLDFWGSWCGWCIKGMPKMKEYYEKYKGKFEILGVDCNDTEAKWKAAVEKHQLPWIHVYNPKDSKVLSDYAVQGFPTKIVIDANGKIIKTIVGEDPAFYTLLDEVLGK